MKRVPRIALVAAAASLGGALLVHAALVSSGASCPMREPGVVELEAQRRTAMLAFSTPRAPLAPSHDTWIGAPRDRFIASEEAAGRRCAVEGSAATVRCDGADGEVLARFDPGGHLVALDRVRQGLGAADAERELAAMLAGSRARLGEPARTWGEATAASLARPLRQSGFEYRFGDVAIDVTATNLGRDGVVLREQRRAMRGLPEGS